MRKTASKPKKKVSARRAKALALHLGLNAVDRAHYDGWSGDLSACEFDAKSMAAIAKSRKMQSTMLLTKKATRKAVLAAVRAAAKKLRAGDLFFLTYSGHGGQMPDVSGEEPDKRDETWCLFDGELIDDELYLELGRFAAGVRVLVLSDSCHSGTVTRAKPTGGRTKMMPPRVADATYKKHQQFYDAIQRQIAQAAGRASVTDPDAALAQAHANGNGASNRLIRIAKKAKAGVILISGCQDSQTSLDGDRNGAFTEQLLNVWANGTFQGNYTKFHAAIVKRMPRTQTPNLFQLGATARFAKQVPFSV
jgi:hypothetical protein